MYITNKTRTDGFGAQYQTIIFTILYAELMNYEFVYTPFSSMEHNYDDDVNFLEKKEELINIRNNFKSINEIDRTQLIDIDLHQLYQTIEHNIDFCVNSNSFKKIKEIFFRDKQTKKLSKNNINIHIRRPNRFDIGDYGYTPDEYYLKVIDEIKKKYNDIGSIKIFSQGDVSEFESFTPYNAELVLNSSIEDTFTELVNSDILVLSKGSFSYCSGLLCDGIVFYLPFWHKPLKKWLVV
jgi:hypothetical protein